MTAVSVVMAAYNGAPWIADQLRSIADQEPRPAEIIVQDDCSSDNTQAVVEAFAERAAIPVRYRRNATRLGYAENFLQASLEAHAPLIAFSDQDDVWLTGKLAAALVAFKDPAVMAWSHELRAVDAQLRPLPSRRLHTGLNVRAARRNPLMPVPACCLVFRGSLLTAFPPGNRCRSAYDSRAAEHDEWLSFAARSSGRIAYSDQVFLLHRRHQKAIGQFTVGDQQTPIQTLLELDDWRLGQAAGAAEARSAYLYARLVSAADASQRNNLVSAAGRYDALAPRLHRRALQRALPPGPRRLRAMGTAVVSGAYGSTQRGGLGYWAALQDVIAFARDARGEARGR